VTRPGVLGVGGKLDEIGLITLDAHFDMRDLDQGLSNGNPVRALIEDGLPGANIAQVGLASFANSRAMHEDAIEAGNLVITMGDLRDGGIAHAIDRALDHVAHCDALVIDLTEWDPPLDTTDLSALTAARWVAECLAGYELR
jgi:arginase family enzyme